MNKRMRRFLAWTMSIVIVLSSLGMSQVSSYAASKDQSIVSDTEVGTETVKEVGTEAATEASTVTGTEAGEPETEIGKEAATEPDTEAVTEPGTEAASEAATEASSESDQIILTFDLPKGDQDYKGTGAEAYGNMYGVMRFPKYQAPQEAPPSAVLPGYSDITLYMNSHRLLVDGQEIRTGATIKPDVNFSLEMDFELNLQDMGRAGLDYYFEFPEHISIGDKGSAEEPITLYNAQKVTIGTYFIKDDVLYISFPGYYDNVVAFFELGGSWSDTENRTAIDVQWPDRTDTYKIDLCDLSIVKKHQSYVNMPDGSLRTRFSITTRPKTEGASISGITFTDTFSHSSIMKIQGDTYGAGQDIKVSIYNADDSLKETKYYKKPAGGSATSDSIRIPDLYIQDGGYFVVEYEAVIAADDRLTMDAAGGEDNYTNTAKSAYQYYDTTLGREVTLSATASVRAEYKGGTGWIFKEAGDDTKTKYVGGENKTIVPYIITINKRRAYSLGGSIVKDEITNFVGGNVVYDTSASAQTYVEWITSSGKGTVQQKWVILDDALYQDLKALAATSQDTALKNLRNNSVLVQRLVDAINAAEGTTYRQFDDTAALTYVFTDGDSNNFVWFMPIASDIPTSYTIHYDTIVDPAVGEFKNAAGLWYTEYEGAPSAPGWSAPIKKVMNATKSNQGVYIGSDGNYYVDYTVTVGVEAGSAGFEDIGVRDLFPEHKVTLDDGNEYTVYDWLAGFDAGKADVANITAEENIRLVSSVLDISTESTDPAVKKVVDNAYACYYYQVTGDLPAASFRNRTVSDFNESAFRRKKAFWGDGYSAGIYGGKATPAGQFVVTKDLYNSYSHEYTWRKGTTESPSSMIIWLGDLPGTDVGYDIKIRFTMQVNPELVDKLPDILASEGKDYITNTNTAEVWTSFFYNDEMKFNFRTNTKMQTMTSPYWIGINDEHPGVSKTVIGPKDEDQYVTYEVVADPDQVIDAADTTYEVSDILNIAGMKYRPNSFTIRDENDAVVWTNDPQVSVAAKYSGYSGLISLSVDTNDRKSNGFVFSFDNRTASGAKFTDSNGKFMKLKIRYDVVMGDVPTDTTIQNTAGLFELQDDTPGQPPKRKSLGEATVEYAVDKAIDKHISKQPTGQNGYTASYYMDINPSSKNGAKVIRTRQPDGSYLETTRPYEVGDVLEIRDTMSKNQIIKGDSIKVYRYQGVTFENEEDITDKCDLSFDPDTHQLSVDITIEDIRYRYRIVYDCTVEGASNAVAYFENEAVMDHSSAKKTEISSRTLVYEYQGGSSAYVNQIDFHKFDQYDPTKNLSAVFDLYKWDGSAWSLISTGEEHYEKIRTDRNGLATIKNDMVNTQPILWVEDETFYKLVEIEAPEGYVLDPTPIYYYVSKSGESPYDNLLPTGVSPKDVKNVRMKNSMDPDSVIPMIEVTNQEFGLDILKTDEATGDAVKGAGYTLYTDEDCTQVLAVAEDGNSVSKDGNAVYDGTEDGIIRFRNLDPQPGTTKLYLKETTVPANYKNVDEVIELTIQDLRVTKAVSSVYGTLAVDNSGRITKITALNTYRNGRLSVEKHVIHQDPARPLAQFTFTARIYDPDGALLANAVTYKKTDEKGRVTTGTYQSGAVFYMKDGDLIEFLGLPENCTYMVREVKDEDYGTKIQVVDTAGTDNRRMSAGYEAAGSIEDGEKDQVVFENEARVEIAVTKESVLDNGTPMEIPDGLTIRIGTSEGTLAAAVYNGSTGKYELAESVHQDIRLTNEAGGFRVSGLPYKSGGYQITEGNADIETYGHMLTNTDGEAAKNNSLFQLKSTRVESGSTDIPVNELSIGLVNTYSRRHTAYGFLAQKYFSRPLKQGEFQLELCPLVSYGRRGQTPIQVVDVSARGIANFSWISFSEPGTYQYVVQEHIPEVEDREVGVTYDQAFYIVTFKVTENPDGSLHPESMTTTRYPKVGGTPSSANFITFQNTYTATGSTTITAKKNYNKPIPGFKFQSRLTEYTDDTYTEVKTRSGDPVLQTTKYFPTKTTLGETSEAEFKINYKTEDLGTHYYMLEEVLPSGVTEQNPTSAGITYDLTKKHFTVEVEDAGNGVLTTTVTDDDGNADTTGSGSFTNVYDATGYIDMTVEKILYHHSIEANQFTFLVEEFTSAERTEAKLDASGNPIVYRGTYPAASLFENGVAQVCAKTEVTFDRINYTYADIGTHYYRVSEVIPPDAVNKEKDGIRYAGVGTDHYDINVYVTDRGDGTLRTNNTLPLAGMSFYNFYYATGELRLTGSKTLNGREQRDGEFMFMTEDPQNPQDVKLCGRNRADGTIDWIWSSFTQESIGKTFTYRIYEYVPPTTDAAYRPGVTCDDENYYTLTVTIGEGSGGVLDIQTTLKDKDGNDATSLDFVNTYDASADVTFHAAKELGGRDLDEAGTPQFDFDIYEGDVLISSGSSAADGSITFDPIHFYIDGTKTGVDRYDGQHTYTIKERIPDPIPDGYTYDTQEYTITVTATDNGEGGMDVQATGAVLDAGTMTMDIQVPEGRNAVFVNDYEATGTLQPAGTKVLTGRVMEDDEFHFTVAEQKLDPATGDFADTGRTFGGVSKADGTIEYDEIDYVKNRDRDETGVYRYTISEDVPEEPLGGVTYDKKVYSYDVLVADQGDGTLSVTAPAEMGSLDFTNTYTAAGSLVFSLTKRVADLDENLKLNKQKRLKKGLFEFRLLEYDEESGEYEELQTAANEDGGAVSFEPVTYTTSDIGVHIYRITEEGVKETEKSVLYDAEDVYAIVSVTNNGEGSLDVTVEYTTNPEISDLLNGRYDVLDDPQMVNHSTRVKVRKVDDKGAPLAGAKLVLYDEAGKKVLAFTSEDAPRMIHGLERGKTYTLREAEAPKGYRLAEDIQFKLSDKGTILLLADGKEEAVDAIVMRDLPAPVDVAQTGDDSPIHQAVLLFLLSTFGFVMVYKKKRVKNPKK